MGSEWWTVVRFPDGSWSSGGSVDDPEYAHCEVFEVLADSREAAEKSAKAAWRKAPARVKRGRA